MSFMKTLLSALIRGAEPWLPARQLLIIEGDMLPAKLPRRTVILTKDGDEDWSVGFRCPCGCGSVIELLLIKDATPHWSYIVDKNNRPSLYPSVWLKTGCESHFWLKNGRIYWA